jgi:phospholipid/cholesterol/gamma-HCH transport system permease protein
LVVFADAIAIWASYIGVNIKGSVSWSLFHQQVFDSLVFSRFSSRFHQVLLLRFCDRHRGVLQGLQYEERHRRRVGQASHSSVVVASLVIFVLDLIAVQVTDILGYN